MSSIHEESLLSDALSVEGGEGEETSPVSSLLEEQQNEKFGIVNKNGENDNKDLFDDVSIIRKGNIERASLCSSLSNVSLTGELNHHRALSPQFISSRIHSSSSDHKDASDSEVFHQTSASSYLTWEEERERMCLVSAASDSSFGSVGRLNRKSSQSTSISSSTIAHPSLQDWVTFDDSKVESHGIKTPHDSSLPRPPDIPSRKSIQSNSSQGKVDLLSMDNDKLNEHLVKSSPSVGDVPPIPERLLSPKSHTSKTPPTNSPVPSSFNFRLPPPPSSGNNTSLKRQTRSRSSVPSRPSVTTKSETPPCGPPVPPRRDIMMNQPPVSPVASTTLETSLLDVASGSSQDNLIESDHTQQDLSLAGAEYLDSSRSSIDIGSNAAGSSDTCKAVDSEDLMWAPSTPPQSPKSTKKKKRGYQHLSSGSEEDLDDQEEGGDGVAVKVTDSSPIKPLSRWQPIPNEAEDGGATSDNVSPPNSLGDVEAHDDLDIDDVFNVKRLSAEMSGLKGFNRADKGSQNNLVDFSESAEKLGHSSNEDESSENELETVFDMTAQGDSLKRRRKKKSHSSDVVDGPPVDMLQADGSLLDATAPEVAVLTVESDKNGVKATGTSTNPFCSHSPSGDTVSLTPSMGESNPFDRIHFQSSTTPFPAPSTTPQLVKPPVTIPAIAPPPKSAKVRKSSGSFRRRPPQATPVSSPFRGSSFSGETSGGEPQAQHLPSIEAPRLPSGSRTPLASDNLSLLELEDRNDSSSNNVNLVGAASSSLFDHKGDTKPSLDPEKKDQTILEKTLSIVDVFSKSPELDLSPKSIGSTDVKTCQALQMTPAYPDLRESSLDSLEKLQRAISVESPEGLDGRNIEVKKLKRMVQEDLTSAATEWKMLMRFPREKRMLSSRKWVEICVRLKDDKVNHPALQLFHNDRSVDPFFFIELEKHKWTLSPTTQRHRFDDNHSLNQEMKRVRLEHLPGNLHAPSSHAMPPSYKRKVHVVKVLETRYKEKRSFMTKRDKYVSRVPQGFKHSLRAKPVVKLATEDYGELLSFLLAVSDAAFRANRGERAAEGEHQPTVKYHSRDEIVFQLQDQFRGSVTSKGVIDACDVTVHVFATSFLSGDPMATITLNDKKVEGNEVVRRSDIVPSSNGYWVDIRDIEVHKCSPRGYEPQSAAITFYPPDACRFELARLKCDYVDGEPPVTLRTSVVIHGSSVTLRCVLRLSSVHRSTKDQLNQVPCEDLAIRFPLPKSWASGFLKRGLVNLRSIKSERVARPHSASHGTRGIGPVLGHAAMVASVGRAKYEAAHGAVVWRVRRFPEKNAAHNTPQVFTCALQLESERPLRIISDTSRYTQCEVEFTMPSAAASWACIRSVALPNTERAEKFASYGAHFLYTVGMDVTHERSSSAGSTLNCAVQ